MLRDRGLRRTSPETTAESLLRGAHASAVLEGSTATLADVQEGAGDEPARDAVRVSTDCSGWRRPSPALAGAGAHPRALPRGCRGAARTAATTQVLGAAARRRGPADPPDRGAALVVAAVVRADWPPRRRSPHCQRHRRRAAERLVLVARGVDEKSLVVPRPATSRCGRRTSRTCRGVRHRQSGRRSTPGSSTPPRRTPPAREASPLRRDAGRRSVLWRPRPVPAPRRDPAEGRRVSSAGRQDPMVDDDLCRPARSFVGRPTKLDAAGARGRHAEATIEARHSAHRVSRRAVAASQAQPRALLNLLGRRGSRLRRARCPRTCERHPACRVVGPVPSLTRDAVGYQACIISCCRGILPGSACAL